MPLSSDNIAFEVQQAGKTWKDYVENLPSAPGCGGVNSGNYIVRHDPVEYFTNINTQTANFVCFSQFATDLASKTLPNLSWLSPISNAFNESYSITNGTTGRDTITSNGATVSILYLISTTHLVMMDVSYRSGAANPHPAITVGRQ